MIESFFLTLLLVFLTGLIGLVIIDWKESRRPPPVKTDPAVITCTEAEMTPEREAAFLNCLAGLGFPDPIGRFLELTKEYRIRWEKTREDCFGFAYVAEPMDQIQIMVDRSQDPEPEDEESARPVYTLTFADGRKRFEPVWFHFLEGRGGDPRVKDYFDSIKPVQP